MIGYLIGYLLSRVLPNLIKASQTSEYNINFILGFQDERKHDFFTSALLTKPLFVLYSEWEMIKDHVIYYVITARGTNCLEHLYSGRDRSVSHIFKTVTKRIS